MKNKKRYVSAQELLNDSFELGIRIFKSGFKPSFIIGVWRGGTPVAIAVQEILDYFGLKTDHIAIRTSPYYGINQRNKRVWLDYSTQTESQRRCAMTETNRRGFHRQNKDATIQVLITPQYSRDRKDSYDFIPVKMSNQSAEGLCIEIDRALHPGSNVSLKMVSPEEEHPADAHYILDGRVMWCKKVNGKTPRFGVGIQILRRVVQAEVLTSRFK
jgi:hypothetical protein